MSSEKKKIKYTLSKAFGFFEVCYYPSDKFTIDQIEKRISDLGHSILKKEIVAKKSGFGSEKQFYFRAYFKSVPFSGLWLCAKDLKRLKLFEPIPF